MEERTEHKKQIMDPDFMPVAGDTIIQVGDTVFGIPTYILNEQSELFATMFTLAPVDGGVVDGLTIQQPLDLGKADPMLTKEDFKAFATLLCAQLYEKITLSLDECLAVLRYARKWEFKRLEDYVLGICKERAANFTALQRLEIGTEYNLNDILLQGFVDVCCSLSPPHIKVMKTIIKLMDEERFIDLLNARRQVWKHLRGLPARRLNVEWLECFNKPNICYKADLFRQAFQILQDKEDADEATDGTPVKLFETSFREALVLPAATCRWCATQTTVRLDWWIDLPAIKKMVNDIMMPAPAPEAGRHLHVIDLGALD